MKLKIQILSWLLHHANRSITQQEKAIFYDIKNQLLKQYGICRSYEVQFIQGKRCRACHGTGRHQTYYKSSDECWLCNGTGWYAHPRWNYLAIYEFGNYTFHKPTNTVYQKPSISLNIIDGYIEHTKSDYGRFSLFILFLKYKGLNSAIVHFVTKPFKIYYKGVWNFRYKWWYPRNFNYNLIYMVKFGWPPSRKSMEDLPF